MPPTASSFAGKIIQRFWLMSIIWVIYILASIFRLQTNVYSIFSGMYWSFFFATFAILVVFSMPAFVLWIVSAQTYDPGSKSARRLAEVTAWLTTIFSGFAILAGLVVGTIAIGFVLLAVVDDILFLHLPLTVLALFVLGVIQIRLLANDNKPPSAEQLAAERRAQNRRAVKLAVVSCAALLLIATTENLLWVYHAERIPSNFEPQQYADAAYDLRLEAYSNVSLSVMEQMDKLFCARQLEEKASKVTLPPDPPKNWESSNKRRLIQAIGSERIQAVDERIGLLAYDYQKNPCQDQPIAENLKNVS